MNSIMGWGQLEDGFARWLISTSLGLMNFDVEFGITVAYFQPITFVTLDNGFKLFHICRIST